MESFNSMQTNNMSNWIIGIRLQYLKPFNYVQTNELSRLKIVTHK